jgi:hypothetical protein
MAKVVGFKKNLADCLSCNAIVEYSKAEVSTGKFLETGKFIEGLGWVWKKFITCPNCRSLINLK